MNFWQSIPTDPQASFAMQPGEGSLDESAKYPQAAAMLGPPAWQQGLDPPPPQAVPVLLGVITAVALHPLRPLPGAALATPHLDSFFPVALKTGGANVTSWKRQRGQLGQSRR